MPIRMYHAIPSKRICLGLHIVLLRQGGGDGLAQCLGRKAARHCRSHRSAARRWLGRHWGSGRYPSPARAPGRAGPKIPPQPSCACTVTSPCPSSAAELRTSSMPSSIKLHLRAGDVRRAAAQTGVLVGGGKAPGPHQMPALRAPGGRRRDRLCRSNWRMAASTLSMHSVSPTLSRSSWPVLVNAAHVQRIHAAQFDRVDAQSSRPAYPS